MSIESDERRVIRHKAQERFGEFGGSLIIPLPTYIPRARGIHAVGKFGHYWKTLCSQSEHELVAEAAAKCGVTVSMFTRWVAVHAAKEVLQDEHPEPTEPDPSGQ